MHIQESHHNHHQQHTNQNTTDTNKNQPKCFKMTEDVDNKSGMNGIIDSGSGNVGASIIKQTSIEQRGASSSSSSSTGGRLKFFKDGKFILELARAREGERVSWVSVPRKTFWPPQASSTSTPSSTIRQESSTSLSVSDDNSSVQSSPWQRDHSWKQNSPRCNVSSEMTFFYLRPKKLKVCVRIGEKRRRPFDPSDIIIKNNINSNRLSNSGNNNNNNSNSSNIKRTCSSSNTAEADADEGEGQGQDECDSNSSSVQLLKSGNKQVKIKKRKLVDVVKLLWDKKPQVNALKTMLLRQEQMMVSPRKRILRELERVTIDDLSNKRSRAKSTATSTVPAVSSPSRAHNGTAEQLTTTSTTSKVTTSSYSINSLLGHRGHNKNESDSILSSSSSPVSTSPKINYSPKSSGTVRHNSPDLSPSPEHYRYAAAAAAAAVVAQSTIHNSPPPDVYKLYRMHSSPNHYLPPLSHHHHTGLVMNHQKSPQYYTPSHHHQQQQQRSSTSPLSPRSPPDDAASSAAGVGASSSRNRSDYQLRLNETIDKIDNAGHRLLEMEHALSRSAYITPYSLYSSGPSPFVSHPAYYGVGAFRSPYTNPYLMTQPPPTLTSTSQPRNYSTHQSWSNVSQNNSIDRDDIPSDVPLNLSKNAG